MATRRPHPAPSTRTRVRRLPERGVYDRTAIDEVLDAALVAHLGFVHDDQPFVIPTLHARVDDRLYVHGSAASRALRALATGIPACLTVTMLDGIVLARSVFEHSMNYRSVVVLGTATLVDTRGEKAVALEVLRGDRRSRDPVLQAFDRFVVTFRDLGVDVGEAVRCDGGKGDEECGQDLKELSQSHRVLDCQMI